MQVGGAMESTVSTNVPAAQNIRHVALDGRVLAVETWYAAAAHVPPSPAKSVVAVVLGLAGAIYHLAEIGLASPPQLES